MEIPQGTSRQAEHGGIWPLMGLLSPPHTHISMYKVGCPQADGVAKGRDSAGGVREGQKGGQGPGLPEIWRQVDRAVFYKIF